MKKVSRVDTSLLVGGRWVKGCLVRAEDGVATWLASEQGSPDASPVFLKVPMATSEFGRALLGHEIQVLKGIDWDVADSVIERPVDMGDQDSPFIVTRPLTADDGWYPLLDLLIAGVTGVYSSRFLALLRQVAKVRHVLRALGLVVRRITPLTVYVKFSGDALVAVRLVDLSVACSPVDEARWLNLVVGHVFASPEALAGVVTHGGDDFALARLLLCAAYGVASFEAYERKYQQALSSMHVAVSLVAASDGPAHAERRKVNATRRLAALQRSAGAIDVMLQPVHRRLRFDGLDVLAREMLGPWPWRRGEAIEEMHRRLQARVAASYDGRTAVRVARAA